MERNNRNNMNMNSLKDHKKMEDFYWKYSNSNNSQQQPQSYGEEYLRGFSWPPRSYTCSFCKREFRSAQALGGHMNVHRRDRARLRMSPPLPRDNNNNGQSPFLNLNPNPNFVSTPPLVSPFCSFSSQYSASPSEMKTWGALNDPLIPKDSMKKIAKSFSGAEELDGCKLTNKATEIVNLDLEIGLIRDSKEDLDLELRLGYS